VTPSRVARRGALTLFTLVVVASMAVAMPVASADNNRLNYSVYTNIYTLQKQSGCVTDVSPDRRLVDAAKRHTLDLLNNPDINGDIGSDGSTIADRALASGFTGEVAETIAINPAIAISGIEILGQWYGDPAAWATMKDCKYTAVGVWSENSIARTVVVAMYGAPA
jgi:uncharacterized protein YkwD